MSGHDATFIYFFSVQACFELQPQCQSRSSRASLRRPRPPGALKRFIWNVLTSAANAITGTLSAELGCNILVGPAQTISLIAPPLAPKPSSLESNLYGPTPISNIALARNGVRAGCDA